MTWSESEIVAEAQALVTHAEALRGTAGCFDQVGSELSGLDLSSVLSREVGLGTGPTGPSREIMTLVDAILSDTGAVGRDLALVADSVESAAREFLRVDEERAQAVRGLQDRLERGR